MSSDLGLFSFQNGAHGTLSSAVVLRALKPFIRPVIDERYPERWELVFPDGGGGNMGPVIEGEDHWDICINRPCGSDLFDAIYEIMSQTHTLLWWSGMDNMITADESIADHLPADYIEQYGIPPLVRSGADILAEIAKT
jgi:hypothetical protein